MPRAAALLLLAAAAAVALPLAAAWGNVTDIIVTDTSAFPANAAARPPLWPFRVIRPDQFKFKAKGNGWQLDVTHDPIPGVSPNMMIWLFTNLATGTAVSSGCSASSHQSCTARG